MEEYLRVGANFSPEEKVHNICIYSTVDPNHDIVHKWPSVRDAILQILKKRPWYSLSVVSGHFKLPRSGYWLPPPELEKVPIILVGAPSDSKEESEKWWKLMAEEIYSLCVQNGLGDVRVLFQRSRYPLAATSAAAPPPLVTTTDNLAAPGAEILPKVIAMGCGFGPANNDNWSCTLGGAITLQGKDEEPTTLITSVSHVLLHDPDTVRVRNEMHHDPASPISLKLRAPQKLEDSFQRVKRHVALLEDGVKKAVERGDSSMAEEWTVFLAQSKAEYDRICSAKSSGQGSGTLQYGSGLGGEKGFDWSLSSFDHRIMDNKLPTADEIEDAMIKGGYQADLCQVPTHRLPDLKKEFRVTHARVPKANEYVYKQGYTTGLTAGKVNEIGSTLLLMDGMNSLITIDVRAIFPNELSSFMRPGDSGAWIMGLDNKWVGMIIGGEDAVRCPTFGYALDAPRLLDGIEELTKKEVLSPERVQG